jgi:hypothetical protein
MNETISYQLSEHREDTIANRFGAGWYFTFDTEREPTYVGPFDTQALADEAAKAEIQQAMTDFVAEALGFAA